VSDVTLRPMRWWDVEALLPLERELFGPDAWSAETWWGELAQVGSLGAARWYVVACRPDASDGANESIAGYAGASVNGSEAEVMTIAVAPAAQGAGLGARLLKGLLQNACERGATQMLLEVRADNDAAQRLYARHGFEQIARRRGYYGDTDGLVMRRRPLR
jgi:[ribosomal protein S18]-alanine N-acetyltransferase